jgi:putative phosphoesterase
VDAARRAARNGGVTSSVDVKVGLVSDPHANARGLCAALAALRDAGVETVICAGDAVGYGTDVNETIEELRRSVQFAVLGNHDAMLLGRISVPPVRLATYGLDVAERVISPENREWLERLPESQHLELDGVSFAVFHGSPWGPLTEYVYPDHDRFDRFAELDVDVVVLGHTHRQLHRTVEGVTIINPGSCGRPRDGLPGAAYAIVDTRDIGVTLAHSEYDRPS